MHYLQFSQLDRFCYAHFSDEKTETHVKLGICQSYRVLRPDYVCGFSNSCPGRLLKQPPLGSSCLLLLPQMCPARHSAVTSLQGYRDSSVVILPAVSHWHFCAMRTHFPYPPWYLHCVQQQSQGHSDSLSRSVKWGRKWGGTHQVHLPDSSSPSKSSFICKCFM